MDDELACPVDGSFEYGEQDGYLDEPDGTVGVDSEGDLIHLSIKVPDRVESIHARAELDPEQAREVGDWLHDHADRAEE